MPGHHLSRKRVYISKYARSQIRRRARERELQDANPNVQTSELKKEVVKRLCTNSLFFSISKIKNHQNGSLEVKYDEAPYIRLLHKSGLNYVDIEKTLKEEGRYVSRQTISLVARNLKTTLYRVLHIPEPVDIPDDARQWIDKCFGENASVSDVQKQLGEKYGIKASLYQLISIKKELQQAVTGSHINENSGKENSTVETSQSEVEKRNDASSISPKKESDDSPDVIMDTSVDLKLESEITIENVESEDSNIVLKVEDTQILKAENIGSCSSSQDNKCSPILSTEEPLSIICCPDLLPAYTSNISPFPMDLQNDLENSNESSDSGIPGEPLSIICCPDFLTENDDDDTKEPSILSSESETSLQFFGRKGRKTPPEGMLIWQPNGNFTIAFLNWAKRHSTWEGNFAATLSHHIFTNTERMECNCMGIRKKAHNPQKLYLIQQAVFQFYDISDEEKPKVWNNCIKAIDSSSRTFRCKNKLNSNVSV